VAGRPRKTLPGEDRLIKILSLQDPNLTAVDIAPYITAGDDGKGESKVSVDTIRRRLRSYGLFARDAGKSPSSQERTKKQDYSGLELIRTGLLMIGQKFFVQTKALSRCFLVERALSDVVLGKE